MSDASWSCNTLYDASRFLKYYTRVWSHAFLPRHMRVFYVLWLQQDSDYCIYIIICATASVSTSKRQLSKPAWLSGPLILPSNFNVHMTSPSWFWNTTSSFPACLDLLYTPYCPVTIASFCFHVIIIPIYRRFKDRNGTISEYAKCKVKESHSLSVKNWRLTSMSLQQ